MNEHTKQNLIGLFTTKDKAKIAAEEYMKFISTKPVTIEESNGETLYFNGETVIHICEWIVDRAIINNKWENI